MTNEKPVTSNVLLPAVIGAALAAVLGGVIWGYLVILTGDELGFVAWVLGGMSGVAVILLSRGKRGIPFQLISVCSSVVGITIGKYIIFYDSVNKLFKEAYSAEAAKDVSIFSVDLMRVFVENIDTTLDGLDILWVILALITAWIIPTRTRLKKQSF